MGNIPHAEAEDTIEITGNGDAEGEPGRRSVWEESSAHQRSAQQAARGTRYNSDRLPELAELHHFISAP